MATEDTWCTARSAAESSEASERIWGEKSAGKGKQKCRDRVSREMCTLHGTRAARIIRRGMCGKDTAAEEEDEHLFWLLMQQSCTYKCWQESLHPSVLVTDIGQVLTINKTFISISSQLNWLTLCYGSEEVVMG